ncbi:MAG: transposase, partial [Calditrichia bacterium]|nr:transposase [Calditrichia bacterium]
MTKRRKYDDSFKREAVNLSWQSDKSVREIAEELGISKDLLYQWRNKFEQEEKQGESSSRSQDSKKEILRLQKELAETKLERDILKKALA